MIRFMGASSGFTELGEHVSFDENDAQAIGWPLAQRQIRAVGGCSCTLAALEELQLRWKLISHVKLSLQRYSPGW
ncbi:MAG: hypothetical protein SGPRY_004312 [Prymnesium sp.]